MINEQFTPAESYQREIDYYATISVAKTLRERGLITDREYTKINDRFIQQYNPPIASLSTHKLT